MSTRAYRVKKIITDENPSYNCGEDSKLDTFLKNNSTWQEGGMFEITTETLEEAIKEFPKHAKNLQKDLDAANEANEEFVTYQTY